MITHSLENYKKRWRKKLWPKILEVIVVIGVVGIIDVFLKWLHTYMPNYILIIGSILVIVFIIYFFRTHFFENLKPKEFFSAGLDFRQPDDETLAAAIEGIFNFSKSQPYFIHVTPPNEEIKEIFKAFAEDGGNFIHIHGKPGEGKSLLAYHAIYRMEQGDQIYITRNYSLKLDALINKNEDIIKDILDELDGLPTDYNEPSLKLILIDDAHRLPFAHELERQLRIEAEQGNGRFIWITTDFDPFEKTKKKTGDLSINFQAYYLQLVNTLYQSKDATIQKLMTGKFPKLDLAIAQTKGESEPLAKQKGRRINDAWTFNFVASNGFEKLKEDILKLGEDEKYILYLLSGYTAITGENPLSDTEFYDICITYKPNWFQLSFSDYQKTLRGLFEQKPEDTSEEKRRMMLRLSEDSLKNVFVESLHFLFAIYYLKEASQTFLENKRLEMIKASKSILNNDWKKFRYLRSFLLNIRKDVGNFFEQNADWVKNYFEYLQADHLDQYHLVIQLLYKLNNSLFAKIFADDYFQRHSFFFSQLPIYRLEALAGFIYALPSGMRAKMVEQLNVSLLSETISKTKIENFSQAAGLINAFGNRKEELLKEARLIKTNSPTSSKKSARLLLKTSLKQQI